VVVVDLGDILAGRRADDPSGALDEQAVEGDRGGEEQRVECRRVEALADERCCADDEYAVAGLGIGETVDRGAPVGDGHAALQHERLVSACGQQGGEDFYVRDPSGEHEAVAPAPQRGRDVGDDLAVACLVSDESVVHLGERTGRGQVDIVAAEFGLVDVEQASGSRLGRPEVDEGVLTVADRSAGRVGSRVVGDGVPGGSELPRDELVEPVTPYGCGREPEPELGTDPFDRVVVGGCREMVTLVDDDMPVSLGEVGDVVASAREGSIAMSTLR